MKSDTKPLRKYEGYKVVQNTVLDYAENGVVPITAMEIARRHALNEGSVRIAAKYLGIKLAPGKMGGRRYPCNQHAKKLDKRDEQGLAGSNLTP